MQLQDLFAGTCTFTVDNGKNTHYTYKVVKKDKIWFVSLLTGPDNWSNYTYMGMIRENAYLMLTKASHYNNESTPVKVFRWAAEILDGRKHLPSGYSIQHAGKCFRCGRKLTDPESIRTGYGPTCRGAV